MASVTESLSRGPFPAGSHTAPMHKSIPILPSTSASSSLPPPSQGEPMDVTPSNGQSMGPPATSSPTTDRASSSGQNSQNMQVGQEQDNGPNGGQQPVVGAAAAAQQPKVVQTAFIHKLYNMLEDQTITHLISWSSTGESFVMSPSSDFARVLSSYFKHTNISSFVRQLNMYGFHKVSDVFHTGSPDSPLWEFKHGNGSFKRGDLVGLREIKRRASRHTLMHRDSFSTGPKPPPMPPQPGNPMEQMPEPPEHRLGMLEQYMHDAFARLARSEDSFAYLHQKCQILTENLMRSQQWNYDMSGFVLGMVTDTESQIYKDASMLRQDVTRQMEMLRTFEDGPEAMPSARQAFFHNLNPDGLAPLSPRQMPRDESRRGSLTTINQSVPFRAPAAPQLAISPRRYGSIGTGAYSPSAARTPVHAQPPPPPPPPPTIQHPLANAQSMNSPPANLSRRHTSADIRLHGWQGQQPPAQSPYASGHNSTHWPSSPHRGPLGGGDQQLRDQLAHFDFNRSSGRQGSRHPTPPMTNDPAPSTLNPDTGWTLPGAKYPFRGLDPSAPPTRRSSMASNVHSLLNPAETAERADEDEPMPDGKRKRLG